ncbi:MarR family transcriptional regulator [Sphaerotilus sp.]|uniref:MarR family winged helix-turn-helix transcriptional regulator n=1 Tax=Sphaerotilus sp. TaxID=2093942 RepID=UPI00286DC6ED|nr:MarR family transcriptional regulator [Sphaerotilus sp.]
MHTTNPAAGPLPPIYTAETYRPERSLGLLMRQVLTSILQEADRRLDELDLTHAQWLPLFHLLCRPEDTTAVTLARDLQVDPAGVTRVLDRLEAKQLVRRERSCTDRRVVNLALTETGRVVAEQVPPVLTFVLNQHLEGFSIEEFEQLMGLLRRLLVNGEAMRVPVVAAREKGAA